MAKREMSEEARAARNAYRRKWYKENKDKAEEYMMRYWEKKAKERNESEEKENG